jgi:hypothetical protein
MITPTILKFFKVLTQNDFRVQERIRVWSEIKD